LPCLRGGGNEGFNNLASAGTDSVFRVLDRRGGGSSGLAFPSSGMVLSTIRACGLIWPESSSNTSFADLKDAGEDGALLSMDVERRLLKVAERFESCDLGRWPDVAGPTMALVLSAASWIGFCLIGGDFNGAFCVCERREREDSLVPSVKCGCGISIEGFDLGTGGGVFVRFLARGASFLGSGGSVKLRRGLGDLTGGGEFLTTTEGAAGGCVGVTGRFCSNILTRELVGGIGVSSVGLSRGAVLAVLAPDCEPMLPLVCGR
jgi:hypothetical protein